ncbi:DNA binding domain-containing protein, excisionase family [Nitrosomonas ureae]|uniref:DNA binding domain-containing protein, excisionase family n=1 Tax=Nitrosomonas ureae TaxID=44577 RepID=A0A285BZC3_9PROT|nr:helix-turn-helix domain-containing protein [Nitrosomonas ureae]SNX60622.1 DNA binding domain-containing protein, excisionase family [Nitrosomonas ureae]
MQSQSAISTILKNHSTDPLLTPPEAAAYIGVTENTLSVWRCVGRYNISFIKVGRLVKYRKSALDAFLVSRTYGGEM